MFGVTEKGFKRKTYDDILQELLKASRERFGENVNTSERSILGMFLRIIAWVLSLVWQLAEKVYFSGYVKYAEGVNLDRLLANTGVFRLGQQYARGEITIYGDDGVNIPPAFIVENGRGIRYETIEGGPVVDGSVTLKVRSLEKGSNTNSDALEVIDIVTPINGIDKVENKKPIAGGRDRETDREFKDRYEKSLSSAGAGTPSSIISAVLALENVSGARLIENDTEFVDDAGRPPHSFEVIVAGGDKEEIAQAILDKKPAGIQTVGEEVLLLQDITGDNRTIKFNYAEEVLVDVELTLQVDNDFNMQLESVIKDTIIKYIGGTLSSGDYVVGTGIGEDVIATQVIRDLWSMEGIVDMQVKMAISGDELKTGNLEIGDYQSSSVNKVVIKYV